MSWIINYSAGSEKDLRLIDKTQRDRIKKVMDTRVSNLENPRSIGESLSGPLKEYWKYRVGDYRVICDIQDNIITILVLAVGNRKQVYRR